MHILNKNTKCTSAHRDADKCKTQICVSRCQEKTDLKYVRMYKVHFCVLLRILNKSIEDSGKDRFESDICQVHFCVLLRILNKSVEDSSTDFQSARQSQTCKVHFCVLLRILPLTNLKSVFWSMCAKCTFVFC